MNKSKHIGIANIKNMDIKLHTPVPRQLEIHYLAKSRVARYNEWFCQQQVGMIMTITNLIWCRKTDRTESKRWHNNTERFTVFNNWTRRHRRARRTSLHPFHRLQCPYLQLSHPTLSTKAHINTYIHIYVISISHTHTHTHTWIDTYIHEYMNTCIHTYRVRQ